MESLGINLSLLVSQLVNFTLLMILLYVLLYKPITRMLNERKERIASSMADVEAARAAAAKAQQEYDRTIAEAQRKAQEIIAQASQTGEKAGAEIKAEAQREADAIKQRALEDAEQAKARALAEVQNEIAGLSMLATERVLGQSVDADMQRKLIDKFLDRVGRRQAMNAESHVQSYVTAFYEAAFDRWVGALEGAAVALTADPKLFNRLQDPNVDFAERQQLLDGVLAPDTDNAIRNLLYTMMQRDDLGAVTEVAEGLRKRMAQIGAGPTPAEVISAIPLTDAQRDAVEARLVAQYGPSLEFSYRVDPAILGGMIIRVGDKLIDGSVASRLAVMKQSLGVRTAE